MDDSNPYLPVDEFEPEHELGSSFARASQALIETRPYVLFLSILGFFVSGLVIVMSPLAMVYRADREAPEAAGSDLLGAAFLVVPVVILCYLLPSVLLWRYARQIGSYAASASAESFAAAIMSQRAFWKYVGMLMMFMLGMYLLVLAATMLIEP